MQDSPSNKRLTFSIDAILSSDSVAAPIKRRRTAPTTQLPHIPPISNEKTILHPQLAHVELTLCQRDLWTKFHELGTEMIVTKTGRRMFPSLQVVLSGAHPQAVYSLFVDFQPVDRKRYRYSFHQSNWVMQGDGDPELPPRLHVHAEAPASGRHWQRQCISFDKIKLTNNQLDENGFIMLNSMHKYQPRIHVALVQPHGQDFGALLPALFICELQTVKTFVFPETQFMAVTAYQNQRITQLKISSNPFAKGFRESDTDDWLFGLISPQLNTTSTPRVFDVQPWLRYQLALWPEIQWLKAAITAPATKSKKE